MRDADSGRDGVADIPRSGSIEPLSPFWAEFRCSRDRRRREELLIAYRFVVEDVLAELSEGSLGGFDLAALRRRAERGLGEAIDRYTDDGAIDHFPAYATRRVRAAVTDGLQQMDWLPRAIVRRQPPIATSRSRRHGEDAACTTVEPAMQGLARSGTDQLGSSRSCGRGSHPAGTARTARSDDDRAPFRALARTVSGHRLEAESRSEDEAADHVRRAIRRLPEQHRTVLTLQFAAGLSLEQVGALLGTSLIGTRRSIEHALSTLRSAMEDDAGSLAAQAG